MPEVAPSFHNKPGDPVASYENPSEALGFNDDKNEGGCCDQLRELLQNEMKDHLETTHFWTSDGEDGVPKGENMVAHNTDYSAGRIPYWAESLGTILNTAGCDELIDLVGEWRSPGYDKTYNEIYNECVYAATPQGGDFTMGEPMDLAWRLLKRQTELGEFHEDFPSSLGPVTEYHGTMNLPAVSEQGIKARSSRKRSKKFVPEQLRGQDITYTTPDREKALAFAQERAQSLGLPSSQVGVVGVRAGDLPSPIQHQEPFGVLGGTMSNVRPSAIPRANIVPMRGDM